VQHPPLTISATSHELGLSESGTRRLDDELAPVRASNGTRLYDAARVALVCGRRAAAKAVSK